ncbi:hypothetical protein, partial [Aeromonas sp.]|uniref:hypothetical protein n=1 Tax=Aeromonas sp. TaxID=647 RepID=UPI00258B9AFB
FFRFDVFGQLSGQCFEFVLVHLLTHEGILLKKLLIRGRLHNWIYRLSSSQCPGIRWLDSSLFQSPLFASFSSPYFIVRASCSLVQTLMWHAVALASW